MARRTSGVRSDPAARAGEHRQRAVHIELANLLAVVIAAAMYKAWIDHITRAGRTFGYGAAGAEGLLKGRKVFIITGRGGRRRTSAARPDSSGRAAGERGSSVGQDQHPTSASP
jgi:FMN-dependent NADH-azoreductase